MARLAFASSKARGARKAGGDHAGHLTSEAAPDTTPRAAHKDSTTADEAKATVHAWRVL